MSEQADNQRVSAEKLVLGLVLCTIGVLGLLDALDLNHFRQLWRYWPMIPVILGLINEINALRERKSNGGYVMLAFGTWMLLGAMGPWGLSYRSAFPVAVIVVGLGMIVHAIVDLPAGSNIQGERR